MDFLLRPGNWQWETLYDNIDDAKVILTVRGTNLEKPNPRFYLERVSVTAKLTVTFKYFKITKTNGKQAGKISARHKSTKMEFGENE